MLKDFLSSSGIYMIPNLVTRLSGFLLLIFYTRFLSPAEYGVVELVIVLFSLLNLVLPLEITQGVARHFSEANQEEKDKIVSTSILFTILAFSLPIAFALIFPELISSSIFDGILSESMIAILAIYMLFLAIQKLLENQLRWNLKPKQYTLLSIFSSVTLFFFPVSLILLTDMTIDGYILGCLASAFLTVIYGFFLILQNNSIKLILDKITLFKLLSFSSPLVLSSAAFYVFSYSDRWMLQFFESSDSVGIYGAASRVASLAAILHVLSRYSFMPLIYANYKEKETSKDVGDIFTQAIYVGTILGCFIFLFKEEIVDFILGEKFSSSSEIIGLLSIAIILMNSYFFLPGLGIAKRTFLMSGISIFVALINIIGNYFLIPVYSMTGAAISSLAASFVMVLLYFLLGQREYKVVISFQKIVIFLIFCTLMTFCALIFTDTSLLFRIISLFLIFIFYLYLSKDLILKLLSRT